MSTAADPIDALTLDEAPTADSAVSALPESMILGAKPSEPDDSAALDTEGAEAKDAAERARGKDGKFAKKEGDEPTVDEGAEGEPAKPEPRPFQYRAVGKTHGLEGATEDADGNLSVPATQVATIRQALNAWHVRQTGEAEVAPVLREKEQQMAKVSAERDEMRYMMAPLSALLDKVQAIFANPNEEQAALAYLDLKQNWKHELRDADFAYREAKLRQPTGNSGRQAPPEQVQDQNDQQETAASAFPSPEGALATTTDYIERVKVEMTTDPRFKGLTPQDWQQYEARCQRSPYAFLRPASKEEAADIGVPPGSMVSDSDKFLADLAEFAKEKSSSRESVEKRAKLAAENSRRTATSINAPPTPGGGRPASGAKQKGATIQSAKDVDAWFESNEL